MTTTTRPINPVFERKINRYRETANAYEKIAKISLATVAILLSAVISLAIQLSRANDQSKSLSNQIRSLRSENMILTNQLNSANDDIETISARVITLESRNKTLASSISGMKNTVDALDESNAKLIKNNKSLNKKLKKFESRSELYDKYEYAIYDKQGKRTDLTYNQIKTGEELMKEQGIDPDLLFGIIMTESNGNEKAASSISTARGYGQFLKGSGKYVYENILHLGAYDHSMAYNGDINIKMAAGYLGYFKDKGYSAYAAVKAYRGVEPTAYIKTINSYIGTKGKSFAQIAANW